MLADKVSLKELKIAFINKDINKLEELSKKTPNFASIEEAKEFLALISQINSFLQKEKIKILEEMNKIKKLKEFNKNQKNFDFKK